MSAGGPHPQEPHGSNIGDKLNWLRAGVLGANDGIVSTAGVVLGVAGATAESSALLVAGVAGAVAGAMSMAAGEYVSVSTQRDSEEALLALERRELREDPEEELAELTGLYVERGLDPDLAQQVAEQLTAKDALAAHAEVELGLDPEALTSPWKAALASMAAFTLGALLPLLTILLVGADLRVPVTVAAVIVALACTGWISARLGYGSVKRAVVRNVFGGALAMAVTHGIGLLIGTQV
ncbi:VIT family protein [Nocardioides sp. zg-536]|uniref:VIT family protein n=1 Tax=Nocardioides faecalis TaxID=2803858 RepID=A0A939BXB2_9ACTN|nr:VIT family protein [Nocardioides faecalis]MBS4752967.1 VIT family protein [Nocardioides faecalis]QVI60748.1 VIT family protein [Nocardioides faecalis]